MRTLPVVPSTMASRTIPVLVCAFLIGVLIPNHCSAFKLQSGHGQLHKLPSTKAILGDNLVMSYNRNGVEYLFKGADADDDVEYRDLYEVAPSPDPESTAVRIRISDSNYLYINSNDQLSSSASDTGSMDFIVSPLETGDRFNLLLPDGLGLVTPNTQAPFKFYLSRRYPDEPLAEFYWREVSVDESYNNDRDNINKTISLIHTSPNLDKVNSYLRLITQMSKNEHFDGSEIFTVGQYVHQDLGAESLPFRVLPTQVQTLLEGGDLRFAFKEYAMKYSFASDLHQDVKPYTLSLNEETGLWAITYATNFQLTTKKNGPLEDIVAEEKQYIFRLSFNLATSSVTLSCFDPLDFGWNPVTTKNASPDFYFRCEYDSFSTTSFNFVKYQ